MSGRILIIDDVPTNRIVMKVKLSAARYDILMASDEAEALTIARTDRPDVIMMDVHLGRNDGIALCSRLKSDPSTCDIPIIMATDLDDTQAKMRGLMAGADDFLAKPIDEIALLARIRSLMRAREQERELSRREATCAELGFAEPMPSFDALAGNIMLIAPTAGEGQRWRTRIADEVPFPVAVADQDAALSLSDPDSAPDVFLIAVDLDQPNEGLRLMSELRSRKATRHSAVLILLPRGDSERAATALDLGANDISYEPFYAAELAVRIRTQMARKQRADRLRASLDDGLRLAVTDSLTGLHNRRYGLRHLDQVAARVLHQQDQAAIIMIDIDHFKRVNDTHGHGAGDTVLRRVAHALRDSLRGEDLVSRLGGEEFLVVLPGSSIAHAQLVAERLRRTIQALEIKTETGTAISVTLSLGIAAIGRQAGAAEQALRNVDRALYQAKDAGRNAVVVSEDAP